MSGTTIFVTGDRVVREAEVRQITGLSRTRRFELMREGRFPRKIKLSDRASGWRLSEVESWLASRPEV